MQCTFNTSCVINLWHGVKILAWDIIHAYINDDSTWFNPVTLYIIGLSYGHDQDIGSRNLLKSVKLNVSNFGGGRLTVLT
jgi:hypothetical protein